MDRYLWAGTCGPVPVVWAYGLAPMARFLWARALLEACAAAVLFFSPFFLRGGGINCNECSNISKEL